MIFLPVVNQSVPEAGLPLLRRIASLQLSLLPVQYKLRAIDQILIENIGYFRGKLPYSHGAPVRLIFPDIVPEIIKLSKYLIVLKKLHQTPRHRFPVGWQGIGDIRIHASYQLPDTLRSEEHT